jgi:ABC transport system ATP-binding/permease protein
MSALLSCNSLSKSFSSRVLFKDLTLSLFEKDRVGLIGRNGSGKTTLLNILSGKDSPDAGTLSYRRGIKIGYVPQICEHPDISPKEILVAALSHELEMPIYEKERLAETYLCKFGFSDRESSAHHLSGGWKKRLSLAKELISSPHLLLMDEPTNHLDLEGILWLETFLLREPLSYVLVSHDRYFLQKTINRVIEIDPLYPKGLFSLEGSYSYFLEKKQEFLEGQLQIEKSLSSKARREEEWLRHSPKARTTKSQSRIASSQELFEELSLLRKRNLQKKAEIDFASTERQTRKLLVAKNLSKKMLDHPLFRHLDFTLSPSSRLGLMGPNGSGKTTLLRLLAGEIAPDEGTIKRAEDLKVVYFDQHRMALPANISLREALSPRGDFVNFRGKPIHINGWCKRFLFSPDLLDMPIGTLSGGERARIHIAHLMLQPADLLLLDEPTNDLDIPTLETLEESLLDFPGALVLITHDRCMMDRICNSLLVLGHSEKPSFYADFAQWETSLKSIPSSPQEKKKKTPSKETLSSAEKKEYEQIEKKISKLEKEVSDLNSLLETFTSTQNQEKLVEVCSSISLCENQIEQLYLRWEELEKKIYSEEKKM